MSPSQLDLMRLGLIGAAADAAADLAIAHPDAVFTSGRRTRREQARAMAENIAKSTRQWINRTYKLSAVRDACQAWIDKHPEAQTLDALEAGLSSVLDGFTPNDLAHLSKHLSGEAFDVKPVDGLSGRMILMALRQVVRKHGGTLLEKEGGIVRWHAQF